MRSLTPLLLGILALSLLSSTLAAAQPGIDSDLDRVAGELERTDRVIERAREQIQISVSGRAGDYLDRAVTIQREAWIKFRGREPRMAMSLTKKARDLAYKAIVTAADEVKAHEKLPEMIESVQDQVERAGAEIRASGDAQAKRLLEGGITQLRRAREEFRGRRYRKALTLLKTARDLIQRALHRARNSSSEETTRVETALERTGALLDEVKARLAETPNARAQKLYDDAKRLYDRAWARHREGRIRLALRLTSQARQSALDALLRLARNPSPEGVERALSIVGQLITDLSPEILASGSERAATLLDSARQRHREATAFLKDGKLARALETARLADGLLRRAAEAAGLK